MHKLGKAICKHRRLILIIALLLLIPSIIGMKATKIKKAILNGSKTQQPKMQKM